MVIAAMKDVEPAIRLLKEAKGNLSNAIHNNANDETKTAAMTLLTDAMSKYDDRSKVAKACIPKVSKPKASSKKAPAAALGI